MEKIKSINLKVENETQDMRMDIVLPKDFSEIKGKLKKLDPNRNAKYCIYWVECNGINICASDYFPDLVTTKEIINGLKEIEKDMENFEKINHNDLCNFMFSNVEEDRCEKLAEDIIDYNDYQDVVFDSFSEEEIWDFLDWQEKKVLVDQILDFQEIITEKADNSKLIQFIFENTNYSIKDIIEKIQNKDIINE